jgi:hypothetical protein
LPRIGKVTEVIQCFGRGYACNLAEE